MTRGALLTLGGLSAAGAIAWGVQEVALPEPPARHYLLCDKSRSFENHGCSEALQDVAREAITARSLLVVGEFGGDPRGRPWVVERDYAATFEPVEVKDEPGQEDSELRRVVEETRSLESPGPDRSSTRLIEALERVARQIERAGVEGAAVLVVVRTDAQVVDRDVDLRKGLPREEVRARVAERLAPLRGAELRFDGVGVDLRGAQREIFEEFFDDVLERRVGAHISQFDAGAERR